MATDAKDRNASSGAMSLLLLLVAAAVIGGLTYSALKSNGLIGPKPEPADIVLGTAGKDVKGIALMERFPRGRSQLAFENSTRVRCHAHQIPRVFGTDRLPTTPYDGIGLLPFLCIVVAWGAAILGLLLAIINRSRWYWRGGLCLLFVSLGLAGWNHRSQTRKLNAFAAEHLAPGGALRCGLCTVSIPRDHESGGWSASILHFEFREDPAKHIILQRVDPMDDAEFKREFSAAAESAAWPEALIFVHGYNVTFEDAARRTAQVAYDIKFGGVATFYSWPSNGQTLTYSWDEESVQCPYRTSWSSWN